MKTSFKLVGGAVFVLSLFLFSGFSNADLTHGSENDDISVLDGKVIYKDIEMELYMNKTCKWDSIESWNIENKSFYPEINGVSKSTPLNEIHWRVNKLNTEPVCTGNQYFSLCKYEKIDFTKFFNKNKIDNYTIDAIYEEYDKDFFEQFIFFFQKIFGYEPEFGLEKKGYILSFYGKIIDLDPSFEVAYDSSTSGFFTNTTASADGIYNVPNNYTGNFSYFVYYNDTASSYWHTNITHNATGGNNNVTLYTRTATSYNVSDDDLIAFWSFNSDNSTDALDELGNINLTRQGSLPDATEGNGTVGKGYYFGADADKISSSSVGTLPSGNNPRTISLWINAESFDTGLGDYLFNQQDATPDNGENFVIGAEDNAVAVGFYGHRIISPSDLSINTWYHVVVRVPDGATATADTEIWINGVEQSTSIEAGGSKVLDTGTASLTIGGTYDGKADEVRVYNRSLSAAEIQNLYELGSYHIEWTGGEDNWISEGVITSEANDTSASSGNFFQFRAMLNTDNLNSLPYMTNHSVGATVIGDDYSLSLTWVLPTQANTTTYSTNYIHLNYSSNGTISTCNFHQNTTGGFANQSGNIIDSDTCNYNFTGLNNGTYCSYGYGESNTSDWANTEYRCWDVAYSPPSVPSGDVFSEDYYVCSQDGEVCLFSDGSVRFGINVYINWNGTDLITSVNGTNISIGGTNYV